MGTLKKKKKVKMMLAKNAARVGGQRLAPAAAPFRDLGATRDINLKDVANQMKSVANIRKITSAMKMVAASKLRGAQTRFEEGMPFEKSAFKVFDGLPDLTESCFGNGKKNMQIVITSDRGLCGGINSFVTKEAKRLYDEQVEKGTETNMVIIGDKGAGPVRRSHGDAISTIYNEFHKNPVSFSQVTAVAEQLLDKEFDSVSIVSNYFKSAIAFESSSKDMPSGATLIEQVGEDLDVFELEGEKDELVHNLFEFQLASTLMARLLESNVVELSQRMNAMGNASSNADEMLAKITLTSNRARQAKITTELIEIISGAIALEG